MNLKSLGHWLLQVIPPLSLVFLLSERGPSLVYLVGLSAICAFVSLFSIFFKALHFKKRKKKLVRPLLTCLVFIALFSVANTSYDAAKELAVLEARQINALCHDNGACPSELKGWDKAYGDNRLKRRVGNWIQYPLVYTNNDKDFLIDMLRGPDLGDRISGGVGKEVGVFHGNL